MNTSIRQSPRRRAVTGVLLASLAIRALVPPGYMPGHILDGEFMVLCPVASATTVALLQTRTSIEHHHGGPDTNGPSVSSACPIGSSLFFDVLPEVESRLLPVLPQLLPARLSRDQVHVKSIGQSHPARGPPHS